MRKVCTAIEASDQLFKGLAHRVLLVWDAVAGTSGPLAHPYTGKYTHPPTVFQHLPVEFWSICGARLSLWYTNARQV